MSLKLYHQLFITLNSRIKILAQKIIKKYHNLMNNNHSVKFKKMKNNKLFKKIFKNKKWKTTIINKNQYKRKKHKNKKWIKIQIIIRHQDLKMIVMNYKGTSKL